MAKLTIPAEEWMYPGHAACPGCGASLSMRLLLKAIGPRAIVSVPACCWTVIGTPFPTTALAVNMIDNPIEATGASISGLRAAADALGLKDVTVVGFAGDGGTADIGLQALSGMLERRTDAIYVMYDNEAYMNTGVQRSGATPQGAWTTTTPVSKGSHGKPEPKKDVMAIVLAHQPPYAATLNPSFAEDFVAKVTKAKGIGGPRFLHIYSPCPPGWRYDSEKTIHVGRLATDSGVFPLYEVEDGHYRITRSVAKLRPVEEYIKAQGRFHHLSPEEIMAIQEQVNSRWEQLKTLVQETAVPPSTPPRIQVVPTPAP